MKKLLALIISISIAVSLTACLPKNEELDEADDKYDAKLITDYEIKGTLTIAITPDPREKSLMENGLVKIFNEMYPNIKVDYEIIAGNYSSAIMSYFNSSTLPDIVWTNSADAFPFIQNKIFLNMDPYIKLETEKNKDYKNQFVESMWKLGQKNYNGSQYVIPRSADKVVTHYNKKMFIEAGVDMSTVKNGWTWDEFLKACEKLRVHFDANGKKEEFIIDAYLNWEAIFYPMLVSYGGKVFNEDKTIAIDNPGTREMLKTMDYLVEKRYVAPLNYTKQANFEGGQGAMLFHSVAVSKFASIEGLKDDYDVVSFPLIGKSPKIGTGIPGYSISADTKNKDIAWLFLSYLLTKDGQDALAQGGSNIPPIRKDMSDPVTNKWGIAYSTKYNMSAYTWGAEYNQNTDFFLKFDGKYQSALIEAVADMITNKLTRPDSMEIQKAIDKCKEDIEDALNS